MVIKDVIKELSKVQKDQGTLVHEIVSENCFTFFSEAMKIARDKDLLGTIHILRKHIFRSFEPPPFLSISIFLVQQFFDLSKISHFLK